MWALLHPDGNSGLFVGITHLCHCPQRDILKVMKKTRRSPTSALRLVARDVRPDARRRIALGRALESLDEATFNVYRDERGRIILEPLVSIPASEAWLFRNRKALDSVRRGLKEAAEGRAARAGSFAEYADDES